MIKFEAIRAPQFDDSKIRLGMIAAIRITAEKAIKDYNISASYWKSGKPKFYYSMSTRKGSDIYFEITWDTPLYTFLDSGVDPHVIKQSKFDRKSGTRGGVYSAGSLPGTISPTGGRGKDLSGPYLSLNQDINWPGIEGRGWSNVIMKKAEINGEYSLYDSVQEAIRKASKDVWVKE